MTLDWNTIKTRAAQFSATYAQVRNERAEAQSFWNDFFSVFGIERRRVAGEAGGLKIQRFARGESGENRWWEPLSGRFTPASVSLIREPIEFDRFKASVTGRCTYF